MSQPLDPSTVLNADTNQLPYRIAVLCYLEDPDGRLLMLHRRKQPNADMYPPIGGKLEIGIGESPHARARREIQREAGLDIDPADIKFIGMVSEAGYEGAGHWLLFCFRITRVIHPDEIPVYEFEEGIRMDRSEDIDQLGFARIGPTVLWPMVQLHQDDIRRPHRLQFVPVRHDRARTCPVERPTGEVGHGGDQLFGLLRLRLRR